MDSLLQKRWKDLFEKAEQELKNERCYNTLSTTSIQELKVALNRSAIFFGRLEMLQLLDKIQPSLQHVQKYVNSITSASQYHPVECLMWSGIQAVLLVGSPKQTLYGMNNNGVSSLIQCAVSGPDELEDVYETVEELNYTLPGIERDLSHFPDRPELQWHLQDIYEDFLNYCIISVRYFKSRPGCKFSSKKMDQRAMS